MFLYWGCQVSLGSWLYWPEAGPCVRDPKGRGYLRQTSDCLFLAMRIHCRKRAFQSPSWLDKNLLFTGSVTLSSNCTSLGSISPSKMKSLYWNGVAFVHWEGWLL
jgi:hypothetical protein